MFRVILQIRANAIAYFIVGRTACTAASTDTRFRCRTGIATGAAVEIVVVQIGTFTVTATHAVITGNFANAVDTGFGFGTRMATGTTVVLLYIQVMTAVTARCLACRATENTLAVPAALALSGVTEMRILRRGACAAILHILLRIDTGSVTIFFASRTIVTANAINTNLTTSTRHTAGTTVAIIRIQSNTPAIAFFCATRTEFRTKALKTHISRRTDVIEI